MGSSCIDAVPEGNPGNPECTEYLIGVEEVEICCDDGLTGDPCIDYGLCGPTQQNLKIKPIVCCIKQGKK